MLLVQSRTALARLSGPTDPCASAVRTEPFSASAIRDRVRLFATTTKICIRGGSTRSRDRQLPRHRDGPPTRRAPDSRPLAPRRASGRRAYAATGRHRSDACAPSILRAAWFGRCVVTRSLASADFHGHLPAVLTKRHLSPWIRCASRRAP